MSSSVILLLGVFDHQSSLASLPSHLLLLCCLDSSKMLPRPRQILQKCTNFWSSNVHSVPFLKSSSNIVLLWYILFIVHYVFPMNFIIISTIRHANIFSIYFIPISIILTNFLPLLWSEIFSMQVNLDNRKEVTNRANVKKKAFYW